MITTVTLNASIDKMYRLACDFKTGSVMRVAEVSNSAGGKGLNSSRAIAACGEDVCATGFVGGHNGNALCELAQADGIPCDFVHVAAETRCCINAIDATGESTELLEPGRAVTADEVAQMEKKMAELAAKSDVVTISGSAPAGCPSDIYRRLVAIVKEAGKPVILDTSGKLLIESLEAAPTMVKPNTDEIEQVLGHKPQGIEEISAAAVELREKFGIGQVVVSLVGDGSVMACEDGVYRVTREPIECVNPVGAGDTMVGTFAVAMARGMAPADQIKFASACATANCLTQYTGRFEMATAQELMEHTIVEKIG